MLRQVPTMKKIDLLFLICVFGFAAFFCLVSVQETLQLLPGRSSSAGPAVGTAGQPREVDMDRLQQMLQRQDLSSREAMYYKPVPSVSDNGGEASGDGSTSPRETPEARGSPER